jgi:hypothetical protein
MTDDELMYLGAAAMLPHMLVAADATDDWEKIEEQAFKALTLSACLLAWQRGAPKEVEDELERLATVENEHARA